ncbi:pectinesterase family protein [Pedobacter sp. ASV28]|uniref:pectinesterase family protein n=1 Tax=Pedobacter sp. ASV28 TaxID=2795123 RepID=UPI0018ECA1B5|nr:pectinesterase family protein [Pedobacter sp. ASV28]
MKKILFILYCLIGYQSAKAQDYPKELTVAQDGSGDFKTIQEAVNAVRDYSDVMVTISIKRGVYKEKLVVPAQKSRIRLLGENRENTIITFDDYSGKGNINTYTSHTVLVQGNDFSAENLTFENSAGPLGQAVALHVAADRVTIKNCKIIGNQDTLFPSADTSRQYYVDCYIEGTTDFIFGAATVVFERCHIHSKKNSYITAASTTEAQPYGFVFLNCKLTADSSFKKVYLGRPWRPYAKTVFINTQMGDHILSAGWSVWNKNENHKTTFYAEYGSYGAGFVEGQRVEWSHQLSKKQVKEYTLKNIFQNKNKWLPKID